MALALTSGKTDAFLQNTAIGELFVNKNLSLALFSEPLKESEFGIAFSKNIPTSVNGRLHMTKYVPDILRNCGINGQDLMRV